MDANKRITDPDRRMAFYIAQLDFAVDFYDDGGGYQNYCWTENERNESVAKWHNLDGKDLGNADYMRHREFQPTDSLINLDNETLAELWGNQGENTYEGCLGNESATKRTRCKRYAVIAWPLSQNIELASKIIGKDGAMAALMSAHVTVEILRSFTSRQRRPAQA